MKQRLFTGIIILICFVFMLWTGGYVFPILVTILTIGTYLEYIKMTKNKPLRLESIISMLFILLLLSPLFVLGQHYNAFSDFVGTLRYHFDLVLIGYVFFLFIISIVTKNMDVEKNAMLILGSIYIGFGFYFFGLFKIQYGFTYVLTIMILIWTTDTCCYVTGKNFGKHNLAPTISPNKTIEGLIGGVIGAFLIGLIVFLTK